MVEPWLLAGDFNEIKSPLEKKGGGRVNEMRCARFNDWIQSCNLIDIEASGPFFTWKGPKWEGLERVYKRLDRSLCNTKWQETFHNMEVSVIPRIGSDHHPMLINLCAEVKGSMVRNFKFEAMWQMHDSFEALVQNNWKGGEDAHVKLTLFQQELIRWNRDVFGRIEGRKRRLLNRLNGIQRSMEHRSNLFLVKLEKELEEELLCTLRQEEVLWFQKSRGRWLKEGDRNTRYYHTKTLIRRRQNKITMIKNDNDEWVEDVEVIGGLFQEFYGNLFREENHNRCWCLTEQQWGAVSLGN